MSGLTLALIVILVFGIIIVVHEMGHFLSAKAVGIQVDQFSVGFGPKLLGFRRGETAYALRALPLGGFVKLAGMDGSMEAGPRSFTARPLWQRLLVIVAGPATNLLMPVIVFFALFIIGSPFRVDAVLPNSPAAAAGIRAGDLIKAVDGHHVEGRADLRRQLREANGKPVVITVDRNGTLVDLPVTPRKEAQGYVLGVSITLGRYGPLDAFQASVERTWLLISGTFRGLFLLATDKELGGFFGPNGVQGPVGIISATAEEAAAGALQLANWVGFLSLSLGLINILPFPALDGGRAAFLVVEAFRGRPVDPAKEQIVHYVGLAILLGVIGFVTYNDVLRLIIRVVGGG